MSSRIPLAAALLCAILPGLLPQRSQAEYDTAAALAALPQLSLPTEAVEATALDGSILLQNACLRMQWNMARGSIDNVVLEDRLNGKQFQPAAELFSIVLADGSRISSGEFVMDNAPLVTDSPVDPASPCLARRLPGRSIIASLRLPDGRCSVEWTASLQADANYLRQSLVLHSSESLDIDHIEFLRGESAELRPGGSVDGSPALCGNIFMGIESPMSSNAAGVLPLPVAAWTPEQMSWPEEHAQDWELGDIIRRDGAWRLRFQYTAGGYRIELTRAMLVQDGRVLAVDEHFGASGIAQVDNDYNFDVQGYDAGGGPVILRAMVRADGGTDSSGLILLSDLQQPARLSCSLPVGVTMEPGRPLAFSAVCGVAPAGQLRRAFNYYLERERAHPYRTFLHYNSWYDIGYFNKYDEQDCLDVVAAYTDELVNRRGVELDSFLFDDGWDDYDSLWDFHDGFPAGFTNVAAASQAIGAGTGVWLSPWGGYGDPREQRIAASAGRGYEMNEGGFALSGPKYYARFRDICLEMITKYNANQFKLDGLGRGNSSPEGSAFNSDFDAAISLIAEMRAARSDVFVNLTTGTWPSPFWLRIADSIYRGGYDHNFAGEGTDRQQWINYRDGELYRNVASGNPLYPLSSLMLHGIIYAKHADKLDSDPGNDLRGEIRSYFGTGTCLQEMYISPELMSAANWDDLAASAKWARQHAHALNDSHWVGGDPYRAEVYGWAGWCGDDAVLTLRNPAAGTQTIALDPAQVFELPGLSESGPALSSPYADQRLQQLDFSPGAPLTIELQPFEVLVFSATQPPAS